MMSQGEIEALTLAMEKAARNLEVNIMLDIVRRIKANLDIEKSMTSSADYQINVLRQMGYSDDYIKKQIQIYLKVSDEEVNRLYNQTTANIYGQYEDKYDSMGKKQTPFGKHPDIQATVAAAVTQTKGTFQNISQTLGFTRIVNGKRQFLPTAKFFQKSLDEAILGVTTGAFSYDVALKKVIQDMTRSGLRTVEYASGRTYRVDSASRTALMTGFRQVIGHINEQLADDLGTDTYEVSYHIGARPTHQPWQGRVYPYKELQSVCGLGTVTGLCGANCYHWYEPFIPGISVRNYTDEELDDMVARENETTPYYGKEYNTYQALQYQRKMELTMRKYRQDIKLMKEGSLNELEIMGAKARYNQTMNEYVRFSKIMKLPEQRDRIYMDGLGRVASDARKMSLNDTSDKWKRAARSELKKDEKSLSWREKETAVIYDSNGKYLFTKRGDERSVSFTKSEIKKMKNCIVSHNHPSGASFSLADWTVFKRAKLQELRAIGEDKVYYIRVGEKAEQLWNMPDDDFIELYEDIRKKIRKEYHNLYKSGKINKKERLLLSSDEYNRIIAEKVGVKYGKEYF